MDIISGYTYSNSYKKRSFTYDGPLFSTSFNTVQGWKAQIGFSYNQRNEDKRTYYTIGTRINYGFAEQKLRGSVYYSQKLENKHNSFLTLSGGSYVNQFNPSNPITENINSISSLFFKNNFMKLYEKNSATISFSSEVTNGIRLNASVDYGAGTAFRVNKICDALPRTTSHLPDNPARLFGHSGHRVAR